MYVFENPKYLHEFLGEATDLPLALNLSNFMLCINPAASEFYYSSIRNEVLCAPS